MDELQDGSSTAPEKSKLDAPSRDTPEPAREPAGEIAAPEPGTLGARTPPAFNLALFALTFASALLAGLLLEETAPEGPNLLPALWRSLGFASSLIAILLSHEMGHFLFARRHKVDASWPYFLPAPLISFIGTLGAVIRLRSIPRTRNALVDIGAAGPIFGFIVTLPVLFIGLKLSHVVAEPAIHTWTLWDSLITWSRNGDFPSMRDGVELGEPLVLQLLERMLFGVLPDGQTLDFHPVALAGWFGLFITALNLLPLGQLDGGHLLYAVSPKLHRMLGPLLSAILVGLGVFTPFVGWLLWGVLTGTVLARHPPLREQEVPMSRARWVVVIVSLLIFIVSFAPVPLAMLTE